MEKYQVISTIGKGSFGLVKKIRRKIDGKAFVWKQINYGKMSQREKQQLVAEVNILREFKHPNIVRYYDRIVDKKQSTIFIIMEYCEGGDMGCLLKKCRKDKNYIDQDVIWKIFTQVLLAINQCHNRPQGKILHRDIKPANLFLDANHNVKLGDFGLSRIMGQYSQFAKTHVGTPYYMSPQQIKQCKYNQKSDIWSLGCLLYEMASLRPPFQATNHLSLAIKIQEGKTHRLPIRYSQHMQNLIQSMLNLSAQSRPSSSTIMKIPIINLRIKEKQLKEKHAELKARQEILNKKQQQLKMLEESYNPQNQKNLKKFDWKAKTIGKTGSIEKYSITRQLFRHGSARIRN